MVDVHIGLEIHIQLLTSSKVFCSCPSSFGEEANAHVCPVCLGYPGVLPVLSRGALQLAYRAGLALNCSMAETIALDRKNYFYPDMAKNYQITQFARPIGEHGWMEYDLDDGERKRVRIHDIHLEEDAGKTIHVSDGALLDFNRAGCSLLEIVTEPDLSSGREAERFLQAFRTMVRYLEVCDGNMEEGSLRCDANVSVNHPGKGLGVKVEIKNLNSSRFVRKALDHEARRQERLLKSGREIVSETRLWDEKLGKTVSMRSKEQALDYRYFPEPDVPSFTLDDEFVRETEAAMVELPLSRFDRFVADYRLQREAAEYLTEEKERSEFFEQAVSAGAPAQEAGSWMKGELAKLLSRTGVPLERITPESFAALINACTEERITPPQGKEVLKKMLETGDSPDEIIEREQMEGGVDEENLQALISSILSSYPDVADQIKDGNMKAIGFLMGKIMKESGGAADPRKAKTLLLNTLGISQDTSN